MTHPLFESMTKQPTYDGQAAQLVELTNTSGVSVVLMDIGATLLSCRLPLPSGEKREVVLGIETMADFESQQTYLGATVGRYANRIANGVIDINGQRYQLVTNQAGNCLHGGVTGFDKLRWTIAEQAANKVIFTLNSPDGEQGFPGNLDVSLCYSLSDENCLEISYFAQTDKATPVNLTNHSYFNLNGAEGELDARHHWLKINADHYLPTTDVGIPLGHLESVDDTGFDFRLAKRIEKDLLLDEQQHAAKGYDHSFYFDPQRDLSEPVARLISHDNQVALDVVTAKPAMQLYTGNWLDGTPARNHGTYKDYAGLALETQFLPDSPNHPEWQQGDCILHPNQEYRYTTAYHFTF